VNQAATPLYRVILHGRWESGPIAERAATPAADPASAREPEQIAGPSLRLSVRDAKSPGSGNEERIVEIDRFPAVVGSSAHADVEITGYYVSARHCTLHWDGQQLSLADHSTNGTWADGERVHRGARVALANGALLGFGRDRGENGHDRYPATRVQLVRQSPAPEAIPVSPSRPTPVAPSVAAAPRTLAADAADAGDSVDATKSGALAVLAIVDASGSPRLRVLKLPYTIGRGSAQDYIVPDANQGVSREHLVIEDIDRGGAVTLNRAADRNGTFSDSHALPERFVWRFGQEIVLGERWTGAPAVRMSLQPAGETL
jgi:pSer/pThr/pTyr-binding forkhead associated (FHA) protein